jgi:hypothetical protein
MLNKMLNENAKGAKNDNCTQAQAIIIKIASKKKRLN